MGSNLQGSFNGAIRAPLIEQGEEGSSSPTSDSEVNQALQADGSGLVEHPAAWRVMEPYCNTFLRPVT